MTNYISPPPHDYQAAIEGAVYYSLPDPGYLRVSGEDRVDFLQRQTTNDIKLLAAGTTLTSVLTSPNARILDVFQLFSEAETISVITLPGMGAKTAAFLQGKIFFMDKVTVEDASVEYVQLDLEGPQAAAVLQATGVAQPPKLGESLTGSLAAHPVRILGVPGLTAERGYRLLAKVPDSAAITTALEQFGAVQLSAASCQILRVEAGKPAHAAEINEDHTPLETNLDAAISSNKGCYTGQEIIARQLTYDKVTKRLAQLRLEGLVNSGDPVTAAGKKAGSISSVVTSPRFGVVALAVLKRPFHETGTALSVTHNGQEIPGKVTTP
ncbi:MAG: hypothetical protein OEZ02_14785 [Anaerolineae bacterium]|nr:hypothetical protein [Anaerolineae bacterium]